MAIEFIYILIVIIWLLFTLNFMLFKDVNITLLCGFFITIIGIYMLINGVPNLNDIFVSYSFSLVHVAIGLYIIVKGAEFKLGEANL